MSAGKISNTYEPPALPGVKMLSRKELEKITSSNELTNKLLDKGNRGVFVSDNDHFDGIDESNLSQPENMKALKKSGVDIIGGAHLEGVTKRLQIPGIDGRAKEANHLTIIRRESGKPNSGYDIE